MGHLTKWTAVFLTSPIFSCFLAELDYLVGIWRATNVPQMNVSKDAKVAIELK